mgnify:CR=1 FL=1
MYGESSSGTAQKVIMNIKNNWRNRWWLVATLAFGAVPAHAVMDGAGHDFFPVAAIFTASATITYTDAVNAGLTVSSGLVVNNGTIALAVSGGSVGIGTGSPTGKIHVSTGTGATSIFVSGSGSTAGNVGIGTAGPTAELHVVGVSSITTSITVNGVEYAYVPRGQVSFFNLTSCPSGWTALTAAQGRYLVGLPSAGTLAATVGTALTNQENRPTGSHVHPVVDAGHTHSIQLYNSTSGSSNQIPGQNSGSLGSQGGAASATTGITISAPSASVADTNAPYMQLLVCSKD